MSGVPVRDYLKARLSRATGSIMGHLEREVFPLLSTVEKQQALRQAVIDALNNYHDSVLDLVKAESGLRNDELIPLLERVHSELVRTHKTEVKAGP